MIDVNETLGHLATSHPASTLVSLRHRLDFCCGGRQTLRDACQARGLDPKALVAEIEEQSTAPAPERWDLTPLPVLIEVILTRYHEPLRRELPTLLEAARKVERVHGTKAACPHGLAAELAIFIDEVAQHLVKEEQVLFPAINAGMRGSDLQMPVQVMLQEHDDHGANLARLRELAKDFTPPNDACATWRALYTGLERVESELMVHIHLENNILFPRALAESSLQGPPCQCHGGH